MPSATQTAGTTGGSSAEPGASSTVEERLKKLDSLYKRGMINKKEYDQKRAEILKDI